MRRPAGVDQLLPTTANGPCYSLLRAQFSILSSSQAGANAAELLALRSAASLSPKAILPVKFVSS
jgi:hypothetical protein